MSKFEKLNVDIRKEHGTSAARRTRLQNKVPAVVYHSGIKAIPLSVDKISLNKFEIQSQRPETLFIKGLSSFLSKSAKLDVKVVNKDVVLFKAIDNSSSYSESGIINRKTGELVHEVTKNIKSENSEKDITFYSCSKLREKV